MSSTRRVRIGNKRFAKSNEESLEKDGNNASKNKGRKRKLTDMLGCQWSKEELEHFYDAYRKHGKDWKKVAGAIRNRSMDMVEALYNMNKAYLSLPDGTATAAGLIAMMIDHYNILEGSDSEQEDNDGSRTSTKFQKRGCGKLRGNSSKGSAGRYPDLLQLQSSPSSFGFLSSKNKRTGDFAGGQPRAVGKRTPRFAVSSTYEKNDGNKIVSPKRKSLKFGRDIGGDDEGAHVAAMALAEAFQRGGSPQVSRTPGSKADIHNCERKYSESEVAYSKVNIHMDDGPECSLGSREAENDDFIRSTSHQLDSGSAGTVATDPKRRKLKGKKSMPGADNHFDDAREACSGTEEEISARNVKDETEVELGQGGPPSSDWVRKRSQHHFFGDENLALDALQTLADLSLNMLLPSSTVESESSAQVKEENKIDSSRPTTNEKVYRNNQKERGKCYCNKRKPQPSVVGAETVKRKTSKSRTLDVNVSFEAKQEAEQSVNKIQKRKRKAPSAKFSEVEAHPGNTLDTSQKIKAKAEDEKQCTAKTKRPSQFSPLSKQIKSTKASECSTSRTELGKAAAEVAEVVPQVFSKSNLSTKSKNRRKLSLQKAMLSREPRSSEGAGENHLDKHTTNEETMDLTEKLSHCLLSPLLRRWCTYEWFYSAIDYPWFAKLEFDDYLNHVGLGHVPRLTRVEWGVIRSSLGKPRRLSQQFLREERQKLEQYRESVRTHYTELRAGTRDGLPTDLARPLSVGQRVIACHPKTREIHDGSILTVDRNRCRVQFDRPELGVEFVMDIDCMPLDPFENIPDALRKRNLVSDLLFEGLNERKPYDYLKGWKGEGPIASRENVETADEPARCSVSDYSMNKLIKHAEEDTIDDIVQARAAANEVALATHQALYSQPCTMAQIQAKEEDIRALAHMTRALDKKGALLIELRQMNEEVASKQNEGEPIRDIENFRKQYAMVLLQLRDANDLIASTLVYLRQRNTFIRNSTHPPMGSVDNSSVPAGPLKESALPNRDSGSHTVGIVETSKCKARAMVDVAVQALISQKEGKNEALRVTEALDSGKLYSGADPGVPGVKSFQSNEPGHGISTQQEPISSSISDPTTANGARDVEPNQIRSANETQFPSELISSCVSTLLMIQSCTERQYPPAEVAQILESAVTTLLPCCSENLPIYREIEACMSAIKNQMLALIPTPTANTPTENSVM